MCTYICENAKRFWLSNSKILYECAYVEDVFLYMYLLSFTTRNYSHAANVPIDYQLGVGSTCDLKDRARISFLSVLVLFLFFFISRQIIALLQMSFSLFRSCIILCFVCPTFLLRSKMGGMRRCDDKLTSLRNNSRQLFICFFFSLHGYIVAV